MENNEIWKCPKCSKEGNSGMFCSECGSARPAPIAPVPPAPVYNNTSNDDLSPEDRKKANILCIISLVLMFVFSTLMSVVIMAINNSSNSSEIGTVITGICGFLSTGSEIAAIAIMIYVRVRYKNSIFGKVLMWLYIVIGILILIGAILLIWICLYEFEKCANGVW